MTAFQKARPFYKQNFFSQFLNGLALSNSPHFKKSVKLVLVNRRISLRLSDEMYAKEKGGPNCRTGQERGQGLRNETFCSETETCEFVAQLNVIKSSKLTA